MINSFPKEVVRNLKYYIYLLIDPSDNSIFYVGKGQGNRVFSHFKNLDESNRSKRINDILKKGLNPKIEILVHGIEDEKTVKKIEASIIDLIDKKNLTNQIGGYESSDFGRMDVNQIISRYSSKKVNIEEKVLLIKLSQTFRYNMSPGDLYEYTRGIWVISEKRRKQIGYVFAVYDGVIQETYKVLNWYKAGETFSVRKHKKEWDENQRWEFVGDIDNEMRKKYKYKSVNHYWKSNAQNPIRYTF